MPDPSHRIRLDTIPEDGLELSAHLGDEWARDAAQHSLDAEPVELDFELQISLVGGYVRVQGTGATLARCTCDRCQEPVTLQLHGDVDLYYSPPPKEGGGDSVLLHQDDLDIGYFDGEAIDLADVLSEQLALWAPSRVRCGDPGVTQVGAQHPCVLPGQSADSDEVRPSSPFAKLRLPK